MSKKSRKRNKKILAAIGIGLGAAALASRKKKSDLAGTEDNKSGSTKITGGTNLNDYDAGTKKPVAKPDSKMPDNLSKNTGKDNKPKKLRFGQVINKQGDEQTLKPFENSGLNFGLSKRKAGPEAPQNQPKKERIPLFESPKNKAIRLSTASGRANTAAQEMMGGYKSGGRVKGCGIAKRGLGRAMKKGKK